MVMMIVVKQVDSKRFVKNSNEDMRKNKGESAKKKRTADKPKTRSDAHE